jgi:hypothetical protein
MDKRFTPIMVVLAASLAVVSTQGQAGWGALFKKAASQDSTAPAAVPAQAQGTPSLPSAKYPNGLGWRAVENDFIDVKARIDVVEGKVDDVKADTVSILSELDDVDADHDFIKDELADIKTDLGMVKDDVSDIKDDIADIATGIVDISDELAAVADDVSMLKNTLQLQVSVNLAGADDLNDLPVTLYVQVTQNGVGLTGLPASAFAFSNSFPFGVASYCGDASCFAEGQDGLYALELEGDWDPTAYAGTLVAQYTVTTPAGDVTSTGTSLATFEVPLAP